MSRDGDLALSHEGEGSPLPRLTPPPGIPFRLLPILPQHQQGGGTGVGRPTAGGRGGGRSPRAADLGPVCPGRGPSSQPVLRLWRSSEKVGLQAGLELVARRAVTVTVKPVSPAPSDGALRCTEEKARLVGNMTGHRLPAALGGDGVLVGMQGAGRRSPASPGIPSVNTLRPGALQAPPPTWLPVRARHSGTGPEVLRHKEGQGSERHG